MADRIRICSPRNYPKLDLGLFEIVLFNRNQVFLSLVSFLNKSKNLMDRDWYLDLMRVEMEVG